jgi:hypothetical protein
MYIYMYLFYYYYYYYYHYHYHDYYAVLYEISGLPGHAAGALR